MSVSYLEIKTNLNAISKKILNSLDDNDRLTYKDLIDGLNLKQSILDKEVARLEGACCIIREKDTADYRKTFFAITEHGIRVLSIRV